MQIDSPSDFEFDLTLTSHIFVNADLLSIDQTVMFHNASFSIEDIIDETFDLNRIRKFNQNNCISHGQDVIGMFGGYCEIVGLLGSSGVMFFRGEEEVLDDEVVLWNIANILIREDDIFLLVDLKVNIEKFLPLSLYFFLTKISIP